MISLPIDEILDDLTWAVQKSSNAIVVAPAGAGKSTRVPPALLRAGLAGRGEIVVLQPRRLPARLLAKRVAEEMGEHVGKTVGYQVRFEEAAGPDTQIRFITEGILSRWLLSDPRLKRASVVILDEFHERHIQTDLALAFLRRMQQGPRPDLKILVMSATLDPDPLSKYLGNAPVFLSQGRLFEIKTGFSAVADDRPLEKKVVDAVEELLSQDLSGDVLVFLPGAAEIRRCGEALAGPAQRSGLEIAPLHGDLALAQQEQAVQPGKKRKVILSTNVAETSITVEGVVAVIDSGLARIASFLPATGMNVLNVGRISRASAGQRQGRAGRLRPGICLRLYSKQDFAARPEYDLPEVKRLDLAEAVLLLRALGIKETDAFPWFEAPPPQAIKGAESLLGLMGAISNDGSLTDLGESMLSFPLHPRLSRLVIEADKRGHGSAGTVLAAIVNEGGIRKRAPGFTKGRSEKKSDIIGDSDLLESLELFEKAGRSRFQKNRIQALGLSPGAVMAVKRQQEQMKRLLRSSRPRRAAAERDRDLLMSVLWAFPDRVAKRRAAPTKRGRIEFTLARGGSGVLDAGSVVKNAEWIVAVELEERRDASKRSTIIRQASAIEPDWLIEMFLDRIEDTKEVVFNHETGRVETLRRMIYDQLVIDEAPDRDPDMERVADLLFEAAWEKGLNAFDSGARLEPWLARVEFVRRSRQDLGLPHFNEKELGLWLREYCKGKRSLKDLARGRPIDFFESKLTAKQKQALAAWAPERIVLASGRKLKIKYALDAEPYAASRIQDFFGMKKGPALAGGRVPLILHLLAPNNRAVQVTTDLEGFWKNHYPKIARELRRRYPRHAWPENPLSSGRKR